MSDEANPAAPSARIGEGSMPPAAPFTGPTRLATASEADAANSNDRAAPASTTARAEAKHAPAPAANSLGFRGNGSIGQAPAAMPGGSGGGKGGSAGGGGGGGPGRRSPLAQRLGDRDFQQVLGKGLADARRNLVVVALFSIVVNTLVLAVPIYLFQMSDRVLTSRSLDTLVMLSIIVMVAILAHVLLDMMRRFILMRVAVDVESRLGGPVLSAAAKAARPAPTASSRRLPISSRSAAS